MTKRIAMAIFISACATLVVGGVASYLMVRHSLTSQLDQAIVERATTVLWWTGMPDATPQPPVPEGDRYIIRTDRGQTVARPPADRRAPASPTIVSKAFADAGGGLRVRTMTLRWDAPAAPTPTTVIYSVSADSFDAVMRRLVIALGVVTIAGAMLTGIVARRVSRIAMRPLADVASIIGEIDDRNLARRIHYPALPEELRPVGIRLNEMLARMEQASAQRLQFMTDAAHELRSPVAALRTTIEVAQERPQDSTALLRALDRCLSSAKILERLAALLTESLSGQHPSDRKAPEPLNAGRLVEDCVALLESQATQKQVALRVDGAMPQVIESDADKLRSITINLLANAIEYTPPGGKVEVRSWVGEGIWHLRVRDTGMGISTEDLKRVFEPFFRADGSRKRDRGHLGLGLFIVKSHATSLNGTCSATSNPGSGTEFVISIPVNLARSAPDVSTSEPRRDTEISGVSC